MGHFLRLFLGGFITAAGFGIEIVGSAIFEGFDTDASALPIPYMDIVQIGAQGFKYLGVLLMVVSILGIIYTLLAGGKKEEKEQEQPQQPQQPRQQPAQQPRQDNQRRQPQQDRQQQPPRSRPGQQPQTPPGEQDRDDQF